MSENEYVIKATCPVDDQVVVRPDEVKLTVWPAGVPDGGAGVFAWTCPLCRTAFELKVGTVYVDQLITAGVKPRWVPAEALEKHYGPEITEADVDSFVHDLDENDCLVSKLAWPSW